MTENRNIGQDVPAEILKTVRRGQETVRRGQEAVVEAIKTWTDTVRTMTPPMPEVRLPFASRLPKPEELVGNAYDLAGKLLAGQRKFAEDVLHATAALLPGSDNAAGNGEQTPENKAADTAEPTPGRKAAGKNGGATSKKTGPSAG
jgi:hypothetical protein